MPAKGSLGNLGTLNIKIDVDLSGLRSGLKQSSDKVKGFVGQIKGVNAELRQVGRSITIASGAIVALGAIGVKTFADFEQSMSAVRAVTGSTAAEFVQLSDFAREMGRTTVFTASESADAMFLLGQAGFKTEQIMASLSATLELAAATGSDLNTVTSLVVGTLNQFKRPAEDAGRFTDVFAASISNSLATIDKLRDALKFVGPVAFQVGESIESTSAALDLLFNAGIEASISGTQLRAILLRLQAPTAKARKAIRELGLSLEEVNPQFNTLNEIIANFERVGAGAIDKGDELKDIFGLRAIAPFQVLVNEGADALRRMEETITGTNEASRQATERLDNIKGAVKLLTSAAQEAAIVFGEFLEPAIRGAAEVLRDGVQVFNTADSTLQKLIITAPLVAAGLGLIVGPVALLIGQIPSLIAGVKALGIAFSGVGGLIGVAVIALGAITAGIYSYITAEERRVRTLKEAIKDTERNIASVTKQQKEIKLLGEEYISLAKKQGDANIFSDRQRKIIDELNSKYPGLITNTTNYASVLDQITKAASDAEKELQSLNETQKELALVKLTLNDVEFRRKLRELQEDATNISLFEKFKNQRINVAPIRDAISALSGTSSILNANIGRTSELYGRVNVSVARLSKDLGVLVQTEEGLASARGDLLKITRLISEREVERENLLAKQSILSGRELNISKARVSTLDNEINSLNDLLDIYVDSTKTGFEIVNINNELKKIAEQRRAIEEGITEERNKQGDGRDKAPIPPAELTDEEKKNIQELESFRFKQRIRVLKAMLALEKESAKESLDNALAALEAERLLRIEQFEKSRSEELAKAQELGADKLEVERSFQIARDALDLEFANRRQKIIDDFAEKERESELRKLEFQFQQQLITEGQYKQHLERLLELDEEYTDQWYDIQQKLTRLQQDENRKRRQEQQAFANAIIDSAKLIGKAFGENLGGAKIDNIFKDTLKSFVDIWANTLKQILAANAIFGKGTTPLNFAAVARATLAIATISAIQAAAKAQIDAAQQGALVKSAGLLQVHKDEAVVPAVVTRSTRQEFQSKLLGTSGGTSGSDDQPGELSVDRRGRLVIEGDLVLNNPVVNDRKFWEDALDKGLDDAMIRRKGRF